MRGLPPNPTTSPTCPLRSAVVTPLHHYYEAVAPNRRVGTFRPRGYSHLRLFPWHRRVGSHVPYESPIEVRAAYMPDAAWASQASPQRSFAAAASALPQLRTADTSRGQSSRSLQQSRAGFVWWSMGSAGPKPIQSIWQTWRPEWRLAQMPFRIVVEAAAVKLAVAVGDLVDGDDIYHDLSGSITAPIRRCHA
jgi:hypothetical protein